MKYSIHIRQAFCSRFSPLQKNFGRILLAFIFFWLASASHTSAATLPTDFVETVLASGLTNPTAMSFSPDGRLFICEQGGALRVVKDGVLLALPFSTLTVNSSGERGLLGVAFDPNFAINQFVYVYYTATTPAVHNRVSRFTASGDVAAGGETVILDLNDLSATNHNGGAIHFGPDGKLYIAVGENANAANSQSIGNLLGKILRINSDGTIPPDNPTTFPGIAGSPAGVNRAIWSVGLRNPYTFSFQPGTGRMFINDVGQSAWEEINDGIAGSNYGWSICEGSCVPPNSNFRDPLFQYGHGISPTTGCAITGGAFYNPAIIDFPADYYGKFLYAEYCSGWIRRYDPVTDTDSAFATGIANPVDLAVTADGSLYYLARSSGSVFRVTFNGPSAANVAVSGRVLTADGRGLRNALVTITDQLGTSRNAITSSFGYYRFEEVRSGETYTIGVSSKRYVFMPRTITVADELTDVDFVAE